MLKKDVIDNLHSMGMIGTEEMESFQESYHFMCKLLNSDPKSREGIWRLRKILNMITDWYFTHGPSLPSNNELDTTQETRKHKICLLEVAYSILEDRKECDLRYAIYANVSLCKSLERCLLKHRPLSEQLDILGDSICKQLYYVPGSEYVKAARIKKT